jgi:hypothetical protein
VPDASLVEALEKTLRLETETAHELQETSPQEATEES